MHHRRRQDLPDLPWMPLLINDQLRAPYFSTNRCNATSSSGLHGPLMRSMTSSLQLPRGDVNFMPAGQLTTTTSLFQTLTHSTAQHSRSQPTHRLAHTHATTSIFPPSFTMELLCSEIGRSCRVVNSLVHRGRGRCETCKIRGPGL